jgi:hypothetical protein
MYMLIDEAKIIAVKINIVVLTRVKPHEAKSTRQLKMKSVPKTCKKT